MPNKGERGAVYKFLESTLELCKLFPKLDCVHAAIDTNGIIACTKMDTLHFRHAHDLLNEGKAFTSTSLANEHPRSCHLVGSSLPVH